MTFRRAQCLFFAAACAVGASAAGCAARAKSGKMYTVICDEDAPTGSHIARTKCYRKIDIDERSRRDHASMQKILYETPRPKGQGPNINKARSPRPGSPLVGPTLSSASVARKSARSR